MKFNELKNNAFYPTVFKVLADHGDLDILGEEFDEVEKKID